MTNAFKICIGSFAAALLALQAVTAALAQTLPFGSDIFGPPGAEEIGDGVYSFRSGAYRTMFMVTGEGVILVDPMGEANAKLIDESIAKLTDKPVKYVVYSQSHRDRAGGAKLFTNRGAKVVAHQECALNLSRTPFPEVVPPDITFTDVYSVKLGGRSMDLYYFGPANDTCAIVAVPRPGDVAFIVNVVIPPGASLPWNMTLADTHTWNIVNFMKRVEDMAAREGVTRIAGSFISATRGPNGRPQLLPGVGPISVVTEQRRFWEMLFADVKAALDAGAPSTAVGTKIDHEKYKVFRRYDEKALNIIARRVASTYVTGR
ncbi:MAG: MBL fold metallo-hydrolase [Rhodobacteraceae bacterium]|nr:MBL fold metallo-hydrolase [Paracoccaceae bacterium]